MANYSETRNIRACLVQTSNGGLKLIEDLQNPVEKSQMENSNNTTASQAEKQIKVVGPDGKVIVFLNNDLKPSQDSNGPNQPSDKPHDVVKPTATITESQARSLATFLSSVKSKMTPKPVDQTSEIASPPAKKLTSEVNNMYSSPPNPQPVTLNPNLLQLNIKSSTAKPNPAVIVSPPTSSGVPRYSLGQGHHGHVIIKNNTPVTSFLPYSPIFRQSSSRPNHVYNRFPTVRPQGSVSLVSNAGPVSPGNRLITLQIPSGSPTSVNIPRVTNNKLVTVSNTTNISPMPTQSILKNSLNKSYQPQVKESPKNICMTVPLVKNQKYNDPILSRIGTSLVCNSGQVPKSTEGQYVLVQPKSVETVKPVIPAQNQNISTSQPTCNTYVAMVPTGVPTFYLPVVLGNPPANNETFNMKPRVLPSFQSSGNMNGNLPEKNLRIASETELNPPHVSSEVVVESCCDIPARETSSVVDTDGTNLETAIENIQDAKSDTDTAEETTFLSDSDIVQTLKVDSESSQSIPSTLSMEGSKYICKNQPRTNDEPLESEAMRVLSKSQTIEMINPSFQTDLMDETSFDMDVNLELDEKENTVDSNGQVKRKRKVPKRFIAEESDISSYKQPRPKSRRTPFVKPIVFYPCFVVLTHLKSGSGNGITTVGTLEGGRGCGLCSKYCRESFLLRKCKESCIQTCPFYEDEKKKLMIDHKYCKQTRRGSFGKSPGPLFVKSDQTHNSGVNISSSKDQSLSDMPSVTGAIIRLPNPIDSLASAKQSSEVKVVQKTKSKDSNTKDQSFSQTIEGILLSPSSETDSALSENYISSEVEDNTVGRADRVTESNLSRKRMEDTEKCFDEVAESNILNEVEECTDELESGKPSVVCSPKSDFEEPFIKDMNMDSDSEIEFNFSKCSPESHHSHQVRAPESEDEVLKTDDESEETNPDTDSATVPKVDSYIDVERLLEEAEVGAGRGIGESDIEDRCDWGLDDLEVDPDSDTENKVNQSEPETDHPTHMSHDLTTPGDSHSLQNYISVPNVDSYSPDRKSGLPVGSPVLNERVQRLKAMLDQQKEQLESLRTKRRRTK